LPDLLQTLSRRLEYLLSVLSRDDVLVRKLSRQPYSRFPGLLLLLQLASATVRGALAPSERDECDGDDRQPRSHSRYRILCPYLRVYR
jgi:hypothetical protein